MAYGEVVISLKCCYGTIGMMIAFEVLVFSGSGAPDKPSSVYHCKNAKWECCYWTLEVCGVMNLHRIAESTFCSSFHCQYCCKYSYISTCSNTIYNPQSTNYNLASRLLLCHLCVQRTQYATHFITVVAREKRVCRLGNRNFTSGQIACLKYHRLLLLSQAQTHLHVWKKGLVFKMTFLVT